MGRDIYNDKGLKVHSFFGGYQRGKMLSFMTFNKNGVEMTRAEVGELIDALRDWWRE